MTGKDNEKHRGIYIDWNADEGDYITVYEYETGTGKTVRKGRIQIEWLDEENDE